jgi:hypothetical protein
MRESFKALSLIVPTQDLPYDKLKFVSSGQNLYPYAFSTQYAFVSVNSTAL